MLREIKARLAAASKGPWIIDEVEGTVRAEDGEIMFDRSCEVGISPSPEGALYWEMHGRGNAELIAHAPEDLKALIAVVEDVQALHAPDAGHPPYCYCGEEEGSGRQCLTCYEEYPCATIRAIEAILHK